MYKIYIAVQYLIRRIIIFSVFVVIERILLNIYYIRILILQKTLLLISYSILCCMCPYKHPDTYVHCYIFYTYIIHFLQNNSIHIVITVNEKLHRINITESRKLGRL